jgi:hypothetical protein
MIPAAKAASFALDNADKVIEGARSLRFFRKGQAVAHRCLLSVHATTDAAPCSLSVGVTMISTSYLIVARKSLRRSTENAPALLRISAETLGCGCRESFRPPPACGRSACSQIGKRSLSPATFFLPPFLHR